MDILLGLAVIYVIYLLIKQETKSKAKKNAGLRAASKVWKSTTKSASTNRISAKSIDEDDDGLANFTISFGHEEAESRNNTPARWISPGETIKIKNHSITGGFFYFGGKLRSLDNWGVDASLVDDYLDVHPQPMLYTDDSLGYWPKYNSISPKARGALLDWLSSDRSNPDTPLGYVFIYFYGLERRVLVDAQKNEVDDAEFQQIFAEITRLKKVYGTSNSFSNYSTRLQEAMCILKPDVVSIDSDAMSDRYDALLFRYSLAKTVKAGMPIPAELARLWLQNSGVYKFKTPARRCRDQFNRLFKIKYSEKFGDGLIVKPNKTALRLHYQTASSTLRGVEINKEDLPDPSRLTGPLNKFIPLADICSEALEAYSRYLGKSETSPDYLAATMLLPDELTSDGNSPAVAKFKRWSSIIISENDGIATVSDFWAQIGAESISRINKKDAELMSNLASKAGVGIAPDINYHHAKPSPDGKIILFDVGHEKGFTPSKAFNDVGMALRLGSMVATSDGETDEAEQKVLESLINDDPKLNFTEKRSLHAYLKWRLNSPPDAAGLKARIEKLSERDKGFISHLLVGVALADGKIDTNEIKQLEKLYTTLGLDRSRVTTDLHGQSSSHSTQKPSPSKAADAEQEVTGFKLNEELISIHESQTKDVQSMLHSIFSEEEEPETAPIESDTDNETNDSHSLDNAHQTLLDALIKEPEWPRQAVEDMCTQYGLMIDGAIEHINDWSFEVFDAPILEDEGDILVDQELVQELQK